MANPLDNGFVSKAQEDFFKRDNPKLWRAVVRKFGPYGSPRHQKHLAKNKKGR